jgi:hypothetical protein
MKAMKPPVAANGGKPGKMPAIPAVGKKSPPMKTATRKLQAEMKK